MRINHDNNNNENCSYFLDVKSQGSRRKLANKKVSFSSPWTLNYVVMIMLMLAVNLLLGDFCWIVVTAEQPQTDLYVILGVQKTASMKEIKSAYRRKALDTHPDKNRDKPPEESAEEFRQVVHAFEILSDETSRKRYDRTGRSDSNGNNSGGNNNNNNNNFHWNFQQFYRPIRLKDRFEVQQAMSRVLHVVSLDQLRTIMLDDNEQLERNILICFTTARLDQHVDDEMVYPYPFAGMSSQSIWWEDVLQTVKIRFHVSNELTKFFGITAFEIDETKEPIFMFGKRGTKLDDESYIQFTKVQTRDRAVFEKWMWEQIEVTVGFVNQHQYPVEVYWIHGTTAMNRGTCEPNATCWHRTMLLHEWYVRDARVDTHSGSPGRYRLTTQSSLGSFKIMSDQSEQEIIIPNKTCFDLSGHCPFYKMHNECINNPIFMDQYCPLTCEKCTGTEDEL